MNSTDVRGELVSSRAARAFLRNRAGTVVRFTSSATNGAMGGNPSISEWYLCTERPTSQSGRLRS